MVETGTGPLGAWALISDQTQDQLRLSKRGLTMAVITTTGCLLQRSQLIMWYSLKINILKCHPLRCIFCHHTVEIFKLTSMPEEQKIYIYIKLLLRCPIKNKSQQLGVYSFPFQYLFCRRKNFLASVQIPYFTSELGLTVWVQWDFKALFKQCKPPYFK